MWLVVFFLALSPVTNGTMNNNIKKGKKVKGQRIVKGSRLKLKKAIQGGDFTGKFIVAAILLRLLLSRWGHVDETRNVMDEKMEKLGGWKYSKEINFENVILLSIGKSEISVTGDGINFAFINTWKKKITKKDGGYAIGMTLILLSGDVEMNPGPSSMFGFCFREFDETDLLNFYTNDNRHAYYEEHSNLIPENLVVSRRNQIIPYEVADPLQYSSPHAKQVSFKTNRDRLIFWAIAFDYFYYDWVNCNVANESFPTIEIDYDTDTTPKTKIHFASPQGNITMHIYWTTGVITVMGGNFHQWCNHDFEFLRAKVDRLSEMGDSRPTIQSQSNGNDQNSTEIEIDQEDEVQNCLNENTNKSRSGDTENEENVDMSNSEEVIEVHDLDERGKKEDQSIRDEIENVKINGIMEMLKEIMAGQRRLEERIGQVENRMRDLRDKLDGNNTQLGELRENDDRELKKDKNRIPTNEPSTELNMETITENKVNDQNNKRTNGRIILEGGSRMKNVKNKINKIEDKEVWVYAQSGSKLEGVLNRLKNNLSEGDKDSVVVIQGGVNDLYKGDSVKTVCKNMADILLYLQGKVRAVIVSSVIPTLNTGRKYDPTFLYKLRKLNYELLNTVKSNGGYYLDLLDSFQKDGELKWEFYKADQLHLNEEGNKLYSNILNEWISSFLGERWDEKKKYKGSRMAYPKGGRKIVKTGL